VNHTRAKALDNDQVQGAFGTFYGGNPVLDPNNLNAEYGRADIDMRNRFVGTLLYKPNLLHNKRFVREGLDGFTFSGTATESGGFPIVAGLSGTVSSLWSVKGLSSPPSSATAADGNIYGGTMSSSSGAATTGRPPQIARNCQPGPGTHNIDFRVTRDIPIHEHISMQFIGEAFNLLNHQIISSVNSTYSTYTGPTAVSGACPANSAVPTGPYFWGCITPFAASTPSGAFGQETGTNTLLYGPRQLQVSAKLFF
jgi:hypothetical protein